MHSKLYREVFEPYRVHRVPFLEFDELPSESQSAVRACAYEVEDEAWFRQHEYQLAIIPMEVATAAVMQTLDAAWVEGQGFKDFESYHAWYFGRRTEQRYPYHYGASRWPVVFSDRDDEVFHDGWHRFHWYYHQGDAFVPCLTWQVRESDSRRTP